MGSFSDETKVRLGISEKDLFKKNKTRLLGNKDPDTCKHERLINIKKGRMRAQKCLDCNTLIP